MSNTIEKLQEEKLRLEINQLRTPRILKPSFIGALTPITLALLTFFAGILSGYFDSTRLT